MGAITRTLANNLVNANKNFRNIFINGDMNIAQRGTSFATMGNGDTQYTLDRFQWNEEGNFGDAEVTITHENDVPTGQGFTKSLKAVCATIDTTYDANTISYIAQKIEGLNLQMLKKGTSSAESLTLSFWAKSNLTGTFTVCFKDIDNTRLYSASYSPAAANTWEKFIITIPGDTTGALGNDTGNSLQVDWNLQAGVNKSNGTLTTAWEAQAEGDRAVGQTNFFSSTSNNFYLTGVQLEVGTAASEFEFLPFDVSLARCQRYYHSIYNRSAGTNANTDSVDIAVGTDYDASQMFIMPQLPVTMRTLPSVVQTTGTDFCLALRNGAQDLFDGFGGTGNSGFNNLAIWTSGSNYSGVTGVSARVRIGNSGAAYKLAANAEL